MRCGWAASSAGTSSTRTCRRSRRRSSRSSTTSRCCCAAWRARRTRSSASPTSDSGSTTSACSWRTTGRSRPTLTLNAGVRYEFFGWPTELDGRIGNVDFEAITNTENPATAFIVPEQRAEHGLCGDRRGDRARQSSADNGHTLKGQDWNNVAPRAGVCLEAGRRTAAGSCAAATGSSTIGRRRPSSTPSSRTIRSCAKSR